MSTPGRNLKNGLTDGPQTLRVFGALLYSPLLILV